MTCLAGDYRSTSSTIPRLLDRSVSYVTEYWLPIPETTQDRSKGFFSSLRKRKAQATLTRSVSFREEATPTRRYANGEAFGYWVERKL